MMLLRYIFNLQGNISNYKTFPHLENPFRKCMIRHVTKEGKEKGMERKREVKDVIHFALD